MKKLRIIRNIVLLLMFINILVIGGYFVYLKSNKPDKKKEEVLVVDEIKHFNYVLDNRKNDYYKSLFDDLKTVLNEEEVNYEEYAKLVSKLFISDLYTLSSKVSSSDVGGIDFVYKDFQKDFLSIAKTTLYNSVKSNLYGERVQELPTVTNVNIDSVSQTTFKYKDINFDESYLVKVIIEYEKDLGYSKNCELVLIKNENVLEVAKLS